MGEEVRTKVEEERKEERGKDRAPSPNPKIPQQFDG